MSCSKRELLARFDSRELSDWQNYYSIEPFGWEQDNLHFGILATLTAPKSAESMAGPRNWFTSELPQISLDDGKGEEED
jgi:hypothetical protein